MERGLPARPEMQLRCRLKFITISGLNRFNIKFESQIEGPGRGLQTWRALRKHRGCGVH